MKTRVVLTLSITVWAVLVSIGLFILCNYENTPGVAATPGRQWPQGSQIQLASDRATLVMLAHPQCPCTRASVGELEELMAQCQGRVKAYVVFLKPKDKPIGWEKTGLWNSATAIPGVTVISDEGGREARRFHATTSGQTLLYDKTGRLIFSGGITASRGHSGDNLGRDDVTSLILNGQAPQHKTLVFGCSLVDPSTEK